MSLINNASFDDIYNKIMLILVANESILYNQYKLYSLVVDKFNIDESAFVPSDFKYKFFIIIRQLMLKDDNIKVIKENNIYYVIYNAPTNIKPEIVNYYPKWIDKSQFNNYIINNNIDLNYQDPESGNTIYHDILSENNCENVKKLLETNNIDYNVTNNYNKTPIECIKDMQVVTIIINDLNKKLNQLEERLKVLENKADCSIIKYMNIKTCDFIVNILNFIIFMFIMISFYLMIKIVI
jgi:hypothetical protein